MGADMDQLADQRMMAGGELAVGDLARGRHDVGAHGVGARAAGAEAAARRRGERRRRLADRDVGGGLHRGVGHGDRLEQQRRVGVRRLGEQLLGRADLAQAAEIHHGDAVAHRLHHGEVVGDEQQGEAVAPLHVLEEVQDLGADRDVERRHRLVADHQLGLEDQRAGDADALALAAGEFVRQAAGDQVGVEADGRQHLAHAAIALGLVGHTDDDQRLGDDVADAAPGIERGDRVLEDQLQAAAHQAHLVGREPGELGAVEHHLARGRAAQLQDGAAQGRLATAQFAHQAQGLALADMQAHIGHRRQRLAADGVFDDQVSDGEQRGHSGCQQAKRPPARSGSASGGLASRQRSSA